MKKFLIGCGGLLAVGLVLVISFVVWYFSVMNREVRYRNEFSAQIKANETNYDNMWKTIQEKYQITDAYKDAVKGVIKESAEGRKGGALFKSIQESVPGLSVDIYKDMMATIEGKRNSFESHQKKLIDIKREHDNLRMTAPSSFVLAGVSELELKLVTSTRTNKAFDSGVDDEVGFKKKD
jgi:hypothetical protein